jgi:hypothetical protein
MNLPEHKLLLLKSLKVDYCQRLVGGLTAEQIAAIAQQDKTRRGVGCGDCYRANRQCADRVCNALGLDQ